MQYNEAALSHFRESVGGESVVGDSTNHVKLGMVQGEYIVNKFCRNNIILFIFIFLINRNI